MKKEVILFSLIFVFSLIQPCSAAIYNSTEGTTVYECGNITETNLVYNLNQSFSTTVTCIRVQANNITLDFSGYNITGDDGAGGTDYGIDVNDYNDTVIRNGYVYDFDDGIYLRGGSTNNTIENMTLNSHSTFGIYLHSSSNNTLQNNTANSNSNTGIYIQSSSNNTLTNNTANSNTGDGITLFSSSSNTLTNNTANSNTDDGIYFTSSSNNNTLTNNTANSNSDTGIRLESSSNNILTNNTANSNTYDGITLSSNSNNNTLTSNIIKLNRYGFFLSSASNNTIQNNTASSNRYYGIYLQSNSNTNVIGENILKLNVRGIFETSSSGNNYTENMLEKNLNTTIFRKIVTQETTEETYSQNSQVYLNLSVYMPNGTAETSFTINDISIYPSESYTNTTSGNNLTINFTATKQGLYSLEANVSDSLNNSETKKFIFLIGDANSDSITYYFHEDEPEHGQPKAASNNDAGSLLLSPVISEETRNCISWIQFSPDEILKPLGIIKNISVNWYYNISGTPSAKIQKYAIYDSNGDYSNSMPTTAGYVWNSTNFTNLNLTSDYIWRPYLLSVKLKGTDPFVMSNSSQSSYATFDYIYAGPNIDEFKENSGSDIKDVKLLSSYFEDDDEKNATLQLDGTGSFNVSVELNSNRYYNIFYDGVNCENHANCTNNSQSNGIVNLTLNLTSKHNITLAAEKISPVVNLTSPPNGTDYSGSSYTVSFIFNVTDDSAISNCSVYASGTEYSNTSAITKGVNNTINATLSAGSYTAYLNCTDGADNIGNSSTISFTITSSGSTGSSSGGSRGTTTASSFWKKTYNISDKEFNQGFIKELLSKERLKITIKEENHYIGIVNLTNKTATIQIASNPKNITFNIGDEKDFDLTNDNYLDLSVRLNSILNNKANITIKSIQEEIKQKDEESFQESTKENKEKQQIKKFLKTKTLYIAILIIIIILIIFYISKKLIRKSKIRKLKKHIKKKGR